MAEDSQNDRNRIWTVPNLLSLVRVVGSFSLIVLAIAEQSSWFLAVYLILAFTDLVDGPVARWLNLRSRLGAILDSIADVTLNGCMLIGICILKWEQIQPEMRSIGIAILSYVVAVSSSYWKFVRFPSYHTWSAKLSHFLVAVGAIVLMLGWSVWPLRIALGVVILANLESVLITGSLKTWRKDVPSIFLVDKEKHKE